MALTAVTPVSPVSDDVEDEIRLDDSSAVARVNLTRPSDHENEMIKVAAQNGPAAVLAVMRSKEAHFSWFVAVCLRAIEVCLGPREIVPTLAGVLRKCDPVAFAMQMLEMEMIDDIFQLMKYYSHVRDVQQHGLAIIEILIMDDPDWRDEVARKGGVVLLCDIAKERKDQPRIMCQVMTCMSYLAAEDYIEVMLCQHDALTSVAYVIEKFAGDAELATRAALALLNLTVCEPHVEELLDKKAILPVLSVLDSHAKDVHLAIIIMGVLANFSVKVEVRTLLVQERVLPRIASAMRLNPGNAVLQVACLKALVNYSTNAEHYVYMDKLGIPNLVGQTMVDHAEDPGVQKYGNYFLGQHTSCPIL